jgi:hypothetical protein
MLTFSTENTLSLEPKSPPGSLACSTIYFLLTSPLLRMNARTKQHLLCKTKPISQGVLMNLTSALTSTYEDKPPLEAPKNKANSKPIGKKAATLAKLHQIRATSSEVRSSVPIRHLWPGFLRCRQPARTKQHLLCKTKPICQPLLMNLTSAITSPYEHKPPLRAPKKQSQSNPTSNPQMQTSQAARWLDSLAIFDNMAAATPPGDRRKQVIRIAFVLCGRRRFAAARSQEQAHNG